LTRGEIRIVQASMLGAILSNILLVSLSLNPAFFSIKIRVLLNGPSCSNVPFTPPSNIVPNISIVSWMLSFHRRVQPRLSFQRDGRIYDVFPDGRRLNLLNHPCCIEPGL